MEKFWLDVCLEFGSEWVDRERCESILWEVSWKLYNHSDGNKQRANRKHVLPERLH